VAGARSIAVATGGFTVEQLREFGADAVLADLSDTQAVLDLLI
jgi:phosphoglycolate phosphatase-like HAD superfamily hydrolase